MAKSKKKSTQGADLYHDSMSRTAAPEQDSRYIGIPDDFTAPYANRVGGYDYAGDAITGGQVTYGPQHYKIDPYETGEELDIVRWSSEDISNFQAWAKSIGYIGKSTKLAVGVADRPTINAYRRVLEFANRHGLTAEEAMANISGSMEDAGEVEQVALPTLQRVNEADLQVAITNAWREWIGENPDPAAINGFISAFRSAEDRSHGQHVSSVRGAADQTGRFVQPDEFTARPSPGALATTQALATPEAQNFQMARQGMWLTDILRSL